MTVLGNGLLLASILALALFLLLPRKAGIYRPEHARLAIVSAGASVLSVAVRLLA